MSHAIRALLLSCLALVALRAVDGPQRPYLLWTAEQAAEMRQRIASDPQARAQYERMLTRDAKQNAPLLNLFRFQILGDESAGRTELAELLKFAREGEPEAEAEGKWVVGNSSASDRHFRDERSMEAWRYDALYHLLTPEQRAAVEDRFRLYIEFHLSGHQPWHPEFRYDRTSWLPNMQYPRTVGTHLMAVALGDPVLLEKVFTSLGGLQWWFDEYLGDGTFYMEEFGKFYSNVGSMIQYANACDRLGLGRFGWDYQGRNGGNLRSFVEMMLRVSLPGTGTPPDDLTYDGVYMGDAGILRVIAPTRADAEVPHFNRERMWGPVAKMLAPLWFEALHARFPEAGYDAFLARFAKPGETVYLPSLYFGLKPVPVTRRSGGPAAPSYSSFGRGFALLRMAEDGSYWSSPRPAVAQQFGMYYVHYVHDALSILNYVADYRHVYRRMGGVGPGYAGAEPWKDSARGQAGGITVDNGQPQPVDSGNAGCRNQRLRSDFTGEARFSACRAGVWKDVDSERMLVLTDEYLLDVTSLVSATPRLYDWQVNAPGKPADEGWTPTSELDGGKLFDPEKYKAIRREFMAGNDLQETRRSSPAATGWSVRIDETPQTGVRVHLLDGQGIIAYQGRIAGAAGNTALLLRAQTAQQVFAVVHEPLTPGQRGVTAARIIARSDQGLLVAVTGTRADGRPFDDRIALTWGNAATAPQTLGSGADATTVTGYRFQRR
jgi:hypothetical protein